MERIDPSGRSFYSPRSRGKKKVKERNLKGVSFSALVEDEARTENGKGVFDTLGLAADASLEEMLDAVYSLGDKVKEHANRETVERYRNAVAAFMRYVLANALEVDVSSSSPNILRQKKFTLVRVIDAKLQRLASGVLSNQQDALDTLARIDEINGLLVDLIS
jgi:uncharacterized protein YaaR (DUF327 family)